MCCGNCGAEMAKLRPGKKFCRLADKLPGARSIRGGSDGDRLRVGCGQRTRSRKSPAASSASRIGDGPPPGGPPYPFPPFGGKGIWRVFEGICGYLWVIEGHLGILRHPASSIVMLKMEIGEGRDDHRL